MASRRGREKGASPLVSNVQVTELITEGEGKHRRVIGVRCHDDEVCKLVVIAEGSNTLLLEQAESYRPHRSKNNGCR